MFFLFPIYILQLWVSKKYNKKLPSPGPWGRCGEMKMWRLLDTWKTSMVSSGRPSCMFSNSPSSCSGLRLDLSLESQTANVSFTLVLNCISIVNNSLDQSDGHWIEPSELPVPCYGLPPSHWRGRPEHLTSAQSASLLPHPLPLQELCGVSGCCVLVERGEKIIMFIPCFSNGVISYLVFSLWSWTWFSLIAQSRRTQATTRKGTQSFQPQLEVTN